MEVASGERAVAAPADLDLDLDPAIDAALGGDLARAAWLSPARSPPAPRCGASPRMARARPPRRGRVRASRDHGQAGPAGGRRRRPPTRWPPAGHGAAGDILWRWHRRDAGVMRPRCAARGLGRSTTVWIGAGRAPEPGAADHVLWVDDGGRDRAATTAGSCCATTCSGSSPTCASSTPACSRRADGVRGRPCASPAPTKGALAEVVAVDDGRTVVGAHRGGSTETVDTTLVGPVAAGRPRARARRARPSPASRRRPMSEGTDFLYPVHRGRRARRRRPARRPRARRPSAKAATSAALRAATLDALEAPTIDAAAGAMAERVRAGRPAVHVRQRRQLDRCRLARGAVRPAALGRRARRRVPGRRHRRAHRARPTTSASSSCSRASSSPTPGPATSRSGISTSGNSRNLLVALRARRERRAAHGRPRGLRRRRDGRGERRAPLPRRPLRQRAPHPGDAGRVGLRALARGPGGARRGRA